MGKTSDQVPEHVSLQSNIPIIPFPDTGETEGLEQILIANRSRVFGDTIVETAVYELPIGTVTYSAGHKTEHHVAYLVSLTITANRCSKRCLWLRCGLWMDATRC